MRRGFTLVEVMIAIIILTTGVLALAATSASVVRMATQSGRLSASVVAAEGRLENLRTTDCTTLSNGTSTDGIYSLAWTVTSTGVLRTIVITVTYPVPMGRGTRSDTYTSAIACAK